MKNFKFKTKPFAHQLEGFNRIKDEDNFLIAAEVGTGKTKLAIDLLRYRYQQAGRVMGTLIVAPKIVLDNWIAELKLHSNSVKFAVIVAGTRAKREKILGYANKQIFITNYESVSFTEDALREKQFECFVGDELHRAKSPRGRNSNALLRVIAKSTFRLGLTGTPVLKSPLDLFMQFKLLDGGALFGPSFFAFRNQYFQDVNLGMPKANYFPDYRIRPGAVELLNGMIQDKTFIKKKSECLDLPEQVFTVRKLEMSKEQAVAYREMALDMITFLEQDAVVAGTAMTKMIRLSQITSGFVKTEDKGTEIPFRTNPKLKAIKEILSEVATDNKVIVWACFRFDLKLLIEELKEYNPAVIYGDTKDKLKEQEKFKHDDTCRIIIANQSSAGIGINLIEANYAIYYSQTYNLAHRLQSLGRNHRSGSEVHDKITYIDLIYPETMDEIILENLLKKEDVANKLISVKNKLKAQLKGGVK